MYSNNEEITLKRHGRNESVKYFAGMDCDSDKRNMNLLSRSYLYCLRSNHKAETLVYWFVKALPKTKYDCS
jgi:hypothetical protein